ncbi:hypothetical protein ACFWH7_00185 [Cellulosimicrobium cellulans]|uniref:hypothetical protein n=1 Tax=Cellulosimicrobium cellulans TaxID=1710 RepID=UPI003649CD5D
MNRPITHEPFDLEGALHSAAAAVHPTTDDAVARERLHRAVRRVRRRRAGLVGTAAALGLVLAGAGLTTAWDRGPDPLMPAPAPSPEPTTTDTGPTSAVDFPAPVTADDLRCGSPAPTATGADLLATVAVETSRPSVRSTQLSDVVAQLRIEDGAEVVALDPTERAGYVLVQDGTVVSTTVRSSHPAHDEAPTRLVGGSVVPVPLSVDSFAICDLYGVGESPSLLPGEYELAAVVPWTVVSHAADPGGVEQPPTGGAGGASPLFDGWLVSRTVPFVVEPAVPSGQDAGSAAPDSLEHAAASPTWAFPSGPTSADLECGMPAPTSSTSLLAFLARPGVVEVGSSTPTTRGSMVYGDSLAQFEATYPGSANAYVVVRDGTIVSSTRAASQTSADLRTMVDGTEAPVPFEYSAEIRCEDGAATGRTLPPGTYTYYGLLPWTITSYSLLQKDGSWGATQSADGAPVFEGWLVSEPGWFVVR